MKALFWIGLVWLGYVYLGYPLAVATLGLVRRVHLRKRNDYLPKVSVLIAARNEERDIRWKIEETLGWSYPGDRLEVLVASDASEDRTDEIVKSIRDPQLKFVRLEPRGGKNLALNHLVERSTGELLFFTDANSHIRADCLRHVVCNFADERVGCVTGEMHYLVDDADPAAVSGDRVYWGYESVIKRLESAIGSVLVCVGSVFCIRRSLYTTLQAELANDLELPVRIGDAGYFLLYEPTVHSMERVVRSAREEFGRRRRVCAQGLLAMWKLRHFLRGLRGWQFFSRKFLRWVGGIAMVLLLVASAFLIRHPWFAALFFAQAAFYGLALVGWMLSWFGRSGGRLVSVPFYIVLVNLAALIGVVDACRGRRFHVWEIASLSRGRQEVTP